MYASSTLVHYPWHTRPAGRLTPAQRAWLLRPDALTAGLRGLGNVTLRVTREFVSGLSPIEAATLGRRPGSEVWVREVIMAIDGVDCVSARSLTPLAASHSVWSGMRRLNTRPLADMLYGDSDIRRSPFTWRQLGLGDPFWYAVRRYSPTVTPTACLLGRQSVFWRKRQPLLVAECFLPAFWQIATSANARSPARP